MTITCKCGKVCGNAGSWTRHTAVCGKADAVTVSKKRKNPEVQKTSAVLQAEVLQAVDIESSDAEEDEDGTPLCWKQIETLSYAQIGVCNTHSDAVVKEEANKRLAQELLGAASHGIEDLNKRRGELVREVCDEADKRRERIAVRVAKVHKHMLKLRRDLSGFPFKDA